VLNRVLAVLRTAAIASGVLLLVVSITPLVPWATRLLSASWTDADGDVLIVLIGSSDPGFSSGPFIGESTYWRTAYTLDAWRRGHFRTILVSGAGGQAVRALLIAYGVPDGAIVLEIQSTTTHESAVFAKPLLAGRSGRFVLLTSDFHMFRASHCFARERITVATRPVPDLLKRSRSLQLRWECFWTLAVEIGKIGYYGLRGWL
jgi:uncharacterized SAM-binding protein YcdF (DUF218 family)